MPTATPPPHVVRFGRVAPTVCVTDLPRALAFYCGVLGMAKTFENGHPPRFAIVERERAELHLAVDPQHRARDENVAHLLVDDAAALHAHLLAAGATIVSPLRDADYGMRTFVLADPDGNRIDVGRISEPTGPPAATHADARLHSPPRRAPTTRLPTTLAAAPPGRPAYQKFEVAVRKSRIDGFGAFAAEPIPAHRKIGEIRGETISVAEARRRAAGLQRNHDR